MATRPYAEAHLEFGVPGCFDIHFPSEDRIAHLRHDTTVGAVAHKRIRFTSTSLAIGEEAAIEALQGIGQHTIPEPVIYLKRSEGGREDEGWNAE